MERIAIIFDGKAWYVRRIRMIERDLVNDEQVYHCDKPISNDHPTLAEVPQVKELLIRAAKAAAIRMEDLDKHL